MTLRLTHLTGGVVTYPAGTRFGPRTLHDYELVWVVQGSVRYHIDGHPDTPMEDGSVVLCRPGQTDGFTWDPQHPTRHAFVHFDFGDRPDDWPEPDDWSTVWHLPADDVVRPLFRYVLANLKPQPAGHARGDVAAPVVASAVQTMLGALLVGPLDQQTEIGAPLPEPVARTLDHARRALDDDTGNPLSLDDLAAAAKVSPEHLCRLFRDTLNTSPVEAVRLLRLDRAIALLVRSDLNVAEIADRTGFASPFHFSRRFKQVYGQSPTATRRAYLEQGHAPINKITERLRLHAQSRGKV